jgi:hypothetical protein
MATGAVRMSFTAWGATAHPDMMKMMMMKKTDGESPRRRPGAAAAHFGAKPELPYLPGVADPAFSPSKFCCQNIRLAQNW